MNTSTEEKLRRELSALGAREFEIVALGIDPDRGLAALRVAVERGVERPVPYAIHLFDAADWQPSGEVQTCRSAEAAGEGEPAIARPA